MEEDGMKQLFVRYIQTRELYRLTIRKDSTGKDLLIQCFTYFKCQKGKAYSMFHEGEVIRLQKTIEQNGIKDNGIVYFTESVGPQVIPQWSSNRMVLNQPLHLPGGNQTNVLTVITINHQDQSIPFNVMDFMNPLMNIHGVDIHNGFQFVNGTTPERIELPIPLQQETNDIQQTNNETNNHETNGNNDNNQIREEMEEVTPQQPTTHENERDHFVQQLLTLLDESLHDHTEEHNEEDGNHNEQDIPHQDHQFGGIVDELVDQLFRLHTQRQQQNEVRDNPILHQPIRIPMSSLRRNFQFPPVSQQLEQNMAINDQSHVPQRRRSQTFIFNQGWQPFTQDHPFQPPTQSMVDIVDGLFSNPQWLTQPLQPPSEQQQSHQQHQEENDEYGEWIVLVVQLFDFMFVNNTDTEVITTINTKLRNKYQSDMNIINNVLNVIAEFLFRVIKTLNYQDKFTFHRETLNILYNNIYEYYSKKGSDTELFVYYFKKIVYQIVEMESKHGTNVIFDFFTSVINQLRPEYDKIAQKNNDQLFSSQDVERYLHGFKRCHDTFTL